MSIRLFVARRAIAHACKSLAVRPAKSPSADNLAFQSIPREDGRSILKLQVEAGCQRSGQSIPSPSVVSGSQRSGQSISSSNIEAASRRSDQGLLRPYVEAPPYPSGQGLLRPPVEAGSQFRSFSTSPSTRRLMDRPPVASHDFVGNRMRSLAAEKEVIARIDPEFSLKEFKRGANAALFEVSRILASDDVTPLLHRGLVEPKAFEEIKKNHAWMNLERRRRLRVNEEDMMFGPVKALGLGISVPYFWFSTIYDIRIIENDDAGLKALEIMMLFDPISKEAYKDGIEQLLDDNHCEKYLNYCNYQFYRDYTDGNNPWILNVVNHFQSFSDFPGWDYGWMDGPSDRP